MWSFSLNDIFIKIAIVAAVLSIYREDCRDTKLTNVAHQRQGRSVVCLEHNDGVRYDVTHNFHQTHRTNEPRQ